MEWDANNKIFDNVLEVIGRTPMIRLNKIGEGLKPDICAKLEYVNPSGSLKDRVVHKIVEEAEKRGDLKPGMILLEGTTGNTGIAAAMVGAAKGYRVIIVMPAGMSEERKKTIAAYGAELVLTPGAETDVDLVLEEVKRIKQEYGEQIFEVGQFYREDNLLAHIDNTAPEIWEQTAGEMDVFIMCQGTGGTVTGTAKYLKEKNPAIKVYVSEPEDSPILACGRIGQHKIQGIADGLIPEILDLQYIDGIILVSSDEALETARQMARKEGVFCGSSSGINVAAAIKVAKKYPEKKCIVTIINDNGLRYLSTELCGTMPERQLLDREYQLSQEDLDKLARYNFEII
ncbi:cysteine synthase A [Syntrophomonas wolfei]|uniref:cysteine synthase n=1 Tax=Syntrophomonas wolfei subsp. wolfei (strain DSM 2245B / Goettingen) TaxID=335541 RepID=Q0AWJ8_SYNWW|nr:cysteine synthase A [Syntrophomonas wolfei]ABI68906.1 cysteine synthase [Syntrophomonas wolfei subsp. wolfei str. Goettingen G311]